MKKPPRKYVSPLENGGGGDRKATCARAPSGLVADRERGDPSSK